MNGPASTPDIMAIAKGIGGGFPLGACLATARGGQGHDAPARTARPSAATRSPWRSATPCSTSCSTPGFLEHVQQIGAAAEAAPRRAGGPRIPASSRRCAARACCSACKLHVAEHRFRRRGRATQKLLGDRGRRQCRAPAAAADRRRGRDRRGGRRLDARLRARSRREMRADAAAGSRRMSADDRAISSTSPDFAGDRAAPHPRRRARR